MSIAERAATWLSHLVQNPSVTPSQAGPRAGEPGEARVADFVAKWFKRLGGDVVVDEIAPGRPNVYGLWPGQTEAWIAVDVHIDTVGVEQMTEDPFSGDIRDGRVWGRGAVDTKATLAVILALIEEMQMTHQIPQASLIIGATVDEEVSTLGAPAFAKFLAELPFPVDQLIVGEPTRCVPVIGHAGVARFELTFHGEAAHSSQPQFGRNAIVAAARTVVAFADEHERLQAQTAVKLGHPSLTSTIIKGGAGENIVPDHCTLYIDRRVMDGEDPRKVIDELYTMAQQAAELPVELTRKLEIPAFYQSAESAWVKQLAEWSGSAPKLEPYGTNAWAYGNLPCETVVLGPGSIDQAHGAEEWVEIAELEKISQIYAKWWGLNLA